MNAKSQRPRRENIGYFRFAKILVLSAVLTLAAPVPAPAQAVDWSKKALQSERSRSYDALHYLIKITLDLDQKTFEGATTVTLASFREGLAACVLDAEEFTVTSVLSDDGQPLKFDQTARELAVHLPRPLKFGEELSFTCFYHGRDPKIGLRFMRRNRRTIPGSCSRIPCPKTSTTGSPASTTRTTRPPTRSWPRSSRV